MKQAGRKITLTVLATVILAILAFFLHDAFLNFVYRQFSDLDVQLISSSALVNRGSFFTFVAVIAVLPSLFLFSHYVLKDQQLTFFLFIIPITVVCGIAMVEFHIYALRFEIQRMNELSFFGIQNTVAIENIHAARFLGIGFLIGVITSTAVLSFLARTQHD